MSHPISLLCLAALLAGLSLPQRSRTAPLAPTSDASQPLVTGCLPSVRDQANPAACLKATSVPTPGLLFPGPHLGGVNNVQSGTDSFVGGGKDNLSSGDHSVVGGGDGNAATLRLATVGGGGFNTASLAGATIAGGYYNSAGGTSAAVGGGAVNTATGAYSTIAGGFFNTAAGPRATVPGGSNNSAAGDFSFAAGRRAKANHAGAFVWGDSVDADKTSSVADQFNVYASGGARIFSNASATAGVLLAPGGGSWSSVSDSASKENVVPVYPRDVLERVCALPIATWNYVSQDDSIRHMGPMAQDFHAAFGLGASSNSIDTIDPDGVALAAIQGLNARLSEAIREREAELAELRAENAALATRVARLESLAAELTKPTATVSR
jgi:hypothetical protein